MRTHIDFKDVLLSLNAREEIQTLIIGTPLHGVYIILKGIC